MTDREIARALRATGGNVVAAATKLILASGPRSPKDTTRYETENFVGGYLKTGKKVKINYLNANGERTEGLIDVHLVKDDPENPRIKPIRLSEKKYSFSISDNNNFDPENYVLVFPVRTQRTSLTTGQVNAFRTALQSLIENDSKEIKDAFKAAKVTYIPWKVSRVSDEPEDKPVEYHRGIEPKVERSVDPYSLPVVMRSRG